MLQVRYVSAAGDVVKAGGPTVKNVSGFDLCRLLVGSRGTLGFLGDVILRTRPRARCERGTPAPSIPIEVLARLYRPTSVLWDGTTTWVLLEGDERDVDGPGRRGSALASRRRAAAAADGRPVVGAARRRSRTLTRHVRRRGRRRRRPPRRPAAAAAASTRRSSSCTGGSRTASTRRGRLNPGVDALDG